MEYKFARRVGVFGLSPIREVLKLASDPSYTSLAAGSPSSEAYPVEAIREIITRLMTEQPEKMLQYGISEGYPPLQKALFARMSQKYGIGREGDGILITSGGQQGIEAFAKTFCDEGPAGGRRRDLRGSQLCLRAQCDPLLQRRASDRDSGG